MNRGKKKHILAIMIVAFIFFYYITMLLPTNSVIKDFEAVVRGEKMFGDDNALMMYSNDLRVEGLTYNKLEINTLRILVIHDFSRGYMVVDYSIKALNDENVTIYSSAKFPFSSLWKIQKENGSWKVVEITEHP